MIPCPHCQSLVKPQSANAPYCCHGCQLAHRFLQDAGLSRYYDLRQGPGVPARDESGAGTSAYLVPLLAAARAAADRDGVVHLSIDVAGIQCAACVYLLEQLFRRREGAVRIAVNPGVGRLDLSFRDPGFDLPAYLDEIARLGYPCGPARKQADAPFDDLLVRFGVAMAIAMNSMIFSFSVYFGLSYQDDRALFLVFSYLNLGLTLLSVIVGGSVFFRGAYHALRRGVLHLDVPIALGILLAFGGSVFSFFTGGGRAAYFDTINTFIALMLLGRLLQRRVVSHNRSLLLQDEGVDGLLLRSLGKDGRLRVVAAPQLRGGDTLLLLPGEMLPTRARLIDPDGQEGQDCAFSLESINGEPEPRVFQRGQLIPAGGHNATTRALRVRTEEDFSASALGALLSAPAPVVGEDPDRPDSSEGRAGFWHRLARRYVAIVLTLAALALVLWWRAGALRALDIATAVLVVTCPCAIGLASPLAYELAQASLRRAGLFVRRSAFLDRLLRVRHVFFDKTGTLTLGELTLAEPAALTRLDDATRADLYQIVSRSSHPKSRALLTALSRALPLPPPFDSTADVSEEPGRGVVLRRGDEELRLGSAAFAGTQSEDDEESVHLSRGGQVLARFRFREELRPGARAQVAALQRAGLRVHLLSGDAPARVAAMAARLGVDPADALGGLSPEQKAARVRALDRQDTLMIGDGINDSLAFLAAYTAGTPAVDRPTLPARADFFFLGRSLGPLTLALELAQRTRRVILRNLVLASLYNVLTVSLALAGKMSPLACALAMPISSIVIVLATMRSYRQTTLSPEPERSPPLPALTSAASEVSSS